MQTATADGGPRGHALRRVRRLNRALWMAGAKFGPPACSWVGYYWLLPSVQWLRLPGRYSVLFQTFLANFCRSPVTSGQSGDHVEEVCTSHSHKPAHAIYSMLTWAFA